MNSKFLAGLAVVIALVTGLTVVSLAKNTEKTQGASAVSKEYAPVESGPIENEEVQTSVIIGDTIVDTQVKVE